jgi:outer membrane protein OmpA-like peptidoglycan-associated protein
VDRVLTDAALGGAAGARISEHMDLEAEALASVLEGLRVERLSEGIKVTVDLGVVFDPDSERLVPGAMDYLSRISQRLIEFEGADVLVVGHAASAAPEADNLSLSKRRALVAVEYLASEGVARDRLSHVGRGESEPIELEDILSEATQRANRRIEIAIFASDQMKAAARLETGGGE